MSEDLKLNKAFCVIPWLHLHVMPDSTVIPCCVSPYHDLYGDVSKQKVAEIWNSDRFKELRTQMIKGELPPGCKHCHDLETAGFRSMRQGMNYKFEKDIPTFIANTDPQGHYQEIKLKYIDIRFSNLCNFKCRGCSPALSSSWYDDHAKAFGYTPTRPKVLNVASDSPDFWRHFQELALDAEFIYFGGGEPLITKEHFDLLRLLIAKGRTDVDLTYNTNLSTLTYGNNNLIDLWDKFRSVTLGISIDDLGNRAEYFRSGTKWQTLVTNLETLRDRYPRIQRYVNCTVNLTNVYYLPELFTYLTSQRFIGPEQFNINLLLDPDEYRIDVLPVKAKFFVMQKLQKFVDQLLRNKCEKAAHDFRNIVSHMMKVDNSRLLPQFYERTRKLDELRGEAFVRTYPELSKLVNFPA